MLLTHLRKGMLLILCFVLLVGLVVPFGSHSVHAAQTETESQSPIAAGILHSLALKSDGTVVGWGNGSGGTIPPGLESVVSIAAGDHSLALKSDGTVVAWGSNSAGQTNVPDGLTDVVSIAAGASHSLALKSDGTIIAWGDNSSGQSTVPTDLNDVVVIAAGGNHSLALRQDKTVVAWGSNSDGQSTIPTGLSGVVAIAAGDTHSLALKSDGTVSVWGADLYDQTKVPTGLKDVVAIAAGGLHSLALKSDGTVVGWGNISSAQESVPQDLNDVVAIAAGSNHALALKSDGTIVGWGSDNNKQIRVPGGSLKDLMLPDGSLDQPFSVNSTSYTSYIGPDVSTVDVVATLADTRFAELYINNELQASGSAVSVDVTEIPMVISVQVKPYFKPDIITYELTLIEDSTAPDIQFTVNGDALASQAIATKVTVTDTESGVDATMLEYAWSQSSAVVPTDGWTTFLTGNDSIWIIYIHALELTGVDGTWYLHVRAADQVGNETYAVTNAFLLDNTAPVVTVASSVGSMVNTTFPVTITFNEPVTDFSIAGIVADNATVSDLIANPDDGRTYTVTITPVISGQAVSVYVAENAATDIAGNGNTISNTISFQYDTTNPTAPIISAPTAWQRNDVSVSIADGEVGGSGVDYTEYRLNGEEWQTYSGEFMITENGETLVEARTVDKATNKGEIVSQMVKLDKVNPNLTLTQDKTEPTKQNVVITAKVMDAHSGVNRIRVADGDWEDADEKTFSVSQNGSYTFEAEDKAGNITSETIEIVNINSTSPTVPPITVPTITAPTISAPTAWQQDDVFVSIVEGEAEGSGVGHTEYRLNGGEWQTYSGEFMITENGETLVEARTVDKATNKGESASQMVKLDKENPSLVLTPNTSKPTNQEVVITAKATDAYSGVKRIRVADGDWEDADEMKFVVSENSSYTFEVEDKVGNITSETIDITNVDKTAPTLTLVGSETIEVEIGDTYDEPGATATDNVDGNITNSIEITGNVAASKIGTYTVRYNVTDKAGNQASEVTREIHVVLPKNTSLVLGEDPINVYANSIVNIKDSKTSIQLPNDLPVGTTLQVKSVQNPPTSGYNLAGELYEFIFTFPNGYEEYTGEYTLTLGVDETKQNQNVAIYYYNEDNKRWEFIGGQIDGGKIIATVDHFSIYGVLTKQSSGGGSSYVPSNDAQLASLHVSGNGESLKLTPAFAADVFDYQLETDAAEISLALKPAHSKAKVYVEEEEITDSLQVELDEGGNALTIVVKAEDGSKKTYTLTIHYKKDDVVEPVVPVVPVAPVMPFTDIDGHWAEAVIMQGVRDGIIKGYPDGTFKPNQYVTRAQAASLIVRALGLKTDETAPFSDIGGYAAETKTEIAAAYHYNIIRGYPDGTFKPTEKVTRAHMALMLNRAYHQQKGMDYIVNDIAPYSDIKGYDEETVNAITMLYELDIATGSDRKYMPSHFTTRAHATKMLVNFFSE
ncbi:OmpL47-type beta-barrel domain-containing protein [Sporosarcina sp. FSL K6-3457]|uniref:OmpL47-type beta-barrel domain-containing protein n=1 Tax=Sporosarcina sp. FSL K6-3457 TaxID=2978204 RepID=UPI0030F4FEAE